MKSSITDWIQAIAVTIGIAFAIREFVLYDRVQERLKKEAVMQLIVSGQSGAISESAQKIQAMYGELRSKKEPTLAEWGNLQAVYFPIQAHLSAWGFCYYNDMCDRQLTEAYICNSLVDFDQFREFVNQQVNNTNFQREQGYGALLNACLAKK